MNAGPRTSGRPSAPPPACPAPAMFFESGPGDDALMGTAAADTRPDHQGGADTLCADNRPDVLIRGVGTTASTARTATLPVRRRRRRHPAGQPGPGVPSTLQDSLPAELEHAGRGRGATPGRRCRTRSRATARTPVRAARGVRAAMSGRVRVPDVPRACRASGGCEEVLKRWCSATKFRLNQGIVRASPRSHTRGARSSRGSRQASDIDEAWIRAVRRHDILPSTGYPPPVGATLIQISGAMTTATDAATVTRPIVAA